ncbi:MAG: diguanylate cyclase [Gemmatimonas sp.]|nr:diguanylate cyclase [Gemmatimonas sp.]
MKRETAVGTRDLPATPNPRWFRRPEFVYSAALFSIAILVLSIASYGAGGILRDHHPGLAFFFFLYGIFTISAGYDQPRLGYVSFDRVSQVASILILGPLDAAWVNGLASLIFPWRRLWIGTPLGRVVTASLNNAGLMALMIFGCGSLYRLLGGPIPLLELNGVAVVLLLVLMVSMQIANEVMLGIHVLLRDARSSWSIHPFALGLEIGSGLTAVLVAIFFNRMELPVVALLLVVLSAGMLALRQFARMRIRLEALVEERTKVLREQAVELERLATHDQLTGLFNRRYADSFLTMRIEEFRRYGRRFSIALIDLDHFKRINDQQSHEVGDQVLKRVARIFDGRCRETDVVARYGGEEFLLCFPEADAPRVARICEELRQTVETTDWSDLASGIHVSLSAGIAEMRHDLDLGGLVNAADLKLYAAKHAGRNLVFA